jgi:nitroreductase
MEFMEVVSKRYSCRAYRPDPVADDKLKQVLEAARLAPTAANRQPFQLVVVHSQGREADLGRIYSHSWFAKAPLVIGICSLTGGGWTRRDGKNYNDVDAAIAMDHLILAAADLGLGTCWIGAFDVAAAREVLGLPEDVVPVVFTPLGYPADSPGPKHRKPLTELVRYERW